LQYGAKDLYVDLGAERLLAARKGPLQIAVEIRSFVGASEVRDLEDALGQYVLYQDVLAVTDPGRSLYLAVRRKTFQEVFEEPLGRLLIDNNRVRLFVFDEEPEEVVRWIPPLTTAS